MESGGGQLFGDGGDERRTDASIQGWQDFGGDLHAGAPSDMADVEVLRVQGTDPETGEDRWWSILGPFPDFDPYGEDWYDWFEAWWEENYGEFA